MIFKPWRFIPAGLAHQVSPFFLNLSYPLFQDLKPEWDALTWRNLHFRNRVGIAGGVDKNAKNLNAWTKIGYGFLEVGTVTPKPQSANAGTIIARSWEQKLLWNKLGFPNEGASIVKQRLANFKNKKQTPIFVNIGKNRETPNPHAHEDYIQLINHFQDVADAFVVNISSPNTKDLRELLKKENLTHFLKPIATAAKNSKLLLKLSPDMDSQDIENIIDVSLQHNFAGWILTNSTIERPNPDRFPEGGGFTGEPVKIKSRELLRSFSTILGSAKGDRLLISAGGILNPDEYKIRRQLGADLVQIYSALVFTGPHFVKILRQSN